MTRQDALDRLSAIGLALEEARCSEWKLVHEVMEWVEGLPVSVPAGDLQHTIKPEVVVGRAGGEGQGIVRMARDDEIVAYDSTFHMERMDDGHIWFQVAGESFDLYAKRGQILWRPQSTLGWDYERAN